MFWKETNSGIVISVKVTPNAKKSEIVGLENDELKIRVAAVPDKGKANDALIAFLAKTLQVSKSQIILVNGLASRHKKLSISGISGHDLSEINFLKEK